MDGTALEYQPGAVPAPDALLAVVRERFGFPGFRPGQLEALNAALAGQDCLAVLPTGGGKSLCYQLPAVLNARVVVVSPLIALMKDQVDAANARGLRATYLASSLDGSELGRRLAGARRGEYDLVYLAPERARAARDLLETASLIAVDEAHCVAQWGHDFRPEYLALGGLLSGLQRRPPVLALTATATPRVRQEIAARLLREPRVVIGNFDRPEIEFAALETRGGKGRMAAARSLVLGEPGAVIVYCATRRGAEETAAEVNAVAYHAGLSAGTRSSAQEAFQAGAARVVCATVAFGMGIDKPDVRLVLHTSLPGSLEAYYQEAGRAGRDRQAARAVLLYSKSDVVKQRRMIERNYPPQQLMQAVLAEAARAPGTANDLAERLHWESTPVNVAIGGLVAAGLLNDDDGLIFPGGRGGLDDAWERVQDRLRADLSALNKVYGYATASGCRRAFLLAHFAQRIAPCGNCDRCRPELTPAVPASALPPGEGLGLPGVKALDRRLATPIAGRAAPAAGRATAPADLDAAPDPELVQALRAYRSEASRQAGVPAYVIYPDRTLLAIAAARPSSAPELLAIPGVGPAKLEKYGPDLLRLISETPPGAPAGALELGTPKAALTPAGPPALAAPALDALTPAEVLEALAQGASVPSARLLELLPNLPDAAAPRVLDALADMGAPAHAARARLNHASEAVAAAALRAVLRAEPRLDLSGYMDDPRPRVRLEAARALTDSAALKELALNDPAAFVRTAARVRLRLLGRDDPEGGG